MKVKKNTIIATVGGVGFTRAEVDLLDNIFDKIHEEFYDTNGDDADEYFGRNGTRSIFRLYQKLLGLNLMTNRCNWYGQNNRGFGHS